MLFVFVFKHCQAIPMSWKMSLRGTEEGPGIKLESGNGE